MDIENFATDAVAEESGVWINIDDGAQVRIARHGNNTYNRLLRDLSEPYAMSIRQGNLDDDIANKIYIKAAARAILLDWKGILENGQAIAYSAEKAESFLFNYPDFRKLIEALSLERENFRKSVEENSIKN